MNEMTDRDLMEDLLLLEKGACDLFMHGAIEASTDEVRSAFTTALNESLTMQDRIYSDMEAKGWYPSDCAEQQKINSVKQKFS